MTRRRLVAACVVLSGVAIAWAADTPGEHVTMGPPNIVARAGAGSNPIMAHNDGAMGIAITGIGQDASCSMTDGTAMSAAFANFPNNMFSFAAGDSQSVNINCPSTGPSASNQGIRRCKFLLQKDPGLPVTDFTGVCLYQSGNTALSATPSPLNFGTVNVGASQAATFTLTTSVALSSLYFSIMDGEANYAVSSPCLGPHCVNVAPLASGGQRSVTVVCSPKRAGNLNTVMHVVGDNGVQLAAPIPLNCSGAAVASGEIELSQETVTLAEPVNGGMQTANVTLLNASATSSLSIASMQLAGANSWSMSVSPPCGTTPCTLAPLEMVNLQIEFHPSTIDGVPSDNDATLTILSSDADEGTKTISLVGTGEGTTLVVDSDITPPVLIGSAQPGMPVTRVFQFSNNPATEPLPFSASISNTPTFGIDVTTGTIPTDGSVSITVTCTPPAPGMHVADFSLDAMPSLGTAPIQFEAQCMGLGMDTSGGDVNLSETLIQRSQNVTAGPATQASVTLQNAHPTETLTITSFDQTGSNAWTFNSGCPTPCSITAGNMINLTFDFDPSIIGDNDGMLTIVSSDQLEPMATITLDGIGEGTTLVVNTNITPPFSIGTAPVGTPVMRTIQFANMPATEPLAFNASITNTSVFTIDVASGAIGTNGTQDILITCTPQAPGTVTADFSLMAMPSFGTAPVELQVECTGTGGNLSWNPTSLHLGDVRIGTAPSVHNIHLGTNGPTLTAGVPMESPSLAQTTLSGVSPTSIVMGPGSDFTVTFDPGTTEGMISSTITVNASGQIATIPFSANIVKAEVTAPTDVDFGSVCVGRTAAPRTIKLVSTGSATVHMAQRPELEGMAGSPFTLTHVSPDQAGYPTDLETADEATITVAPKPMPAGTYVDHVAWMTDATNPTTRLEVDYVEDTAGVTPGAVMFDITDYKQSAAPQTVTIQNCAAGTLTLSAPVFDPPGEFMAISAVPTTLAPGETAEVTLVFMPMLNGTRISTLTVPTSSGDLTVMLSGIGRGAPSTHGAPASLYACDCSTGDPATGFVIVLALVFPLIPRRRRR